MIDLELVLQELTDAGVEFIVVGGVAATIHGSDRVTQDLDIVYGRTPETIKVSGVEYRCLGLARLIEVKRAAGRPKDLEAIGELEVLREERRDQEPAQ